jgi:hypothetical protein
MRLGCPRVLVGVALGVSVLCTQVPARAQQTPPPKDGLLGAIVESLSTNTVSLTPGFRTHLGQNWYFLGAVEVPVAHVKPYDYQVLGAIMKVF